MNGELTDQMTKIRMIIKQIIDNQLQIEFKLMNPNSIFNQFIFPQFQMVYVAVSGLVHKFGYVWENIISAFTTFRKLPTGLDFVDTDRKIFMELKNNFNTANHDSKQNIMRKMRYALNNYPGYKCIYAAVNDTCDRSEIDNNGIIYLSRGKLFQFLFGENAAIIFVITMQEMQNKINEICNNLLNQNIY